MPLPAGGAPEGGRGAMILRMSFEEITALNTAARRMLAGTGDGGVLAPPEALAELETRLPLDGDISVRTLPEQDRLLGAVDVVLAHLRRRMDAIIVDQYVGSDDSVNAYFDYANVLTARSRLAGIGKEMAAMVELITGELMPEEADDITFPD